MTVSVLSNSVCWYIYQDREWEMEYWYDCFRETGREEATKGGSNHMHLP